MGYEWFVFNPSWQVNLLHLRKLSLDAPWSLPTIGSSESRTRQNHRLDILDI